MGSEMCIRDRVRPVEEGLHAGKGPRRETHRAQGDLAFTAQDTIEVQAGSSRCLLYTSDAADD
ncbi:hypothetical protein [Bosea sp. ASV33]|uniref:hypothetical protein n=1 Tax=Bosea sp. ASV33 TaxID=2795106 RepID=UPI0018EE35CE|nr:hypothetical protein [Bosea sp. ASV33]